MIRKRSSRLDLRRDVSDQLDWPCAVFGLGADLDALDQPAEDIQRLRPHAFIPQGLMQVCYPIGVELEQVGVQQWRVGRGRRQLSSSADGGLLGGILVTVTGIGRVLHGCVQGVTSRLARQSLRIPT